MKVLFLAIRRNAMYHLMPVDWWKGPCEFLDGTEIHFYELYKWEQCYVGVVGTYLGVIGYRVINES